MPTAPHETLVTVIIATYNSSRTLRFALESVLAQVFTKFEVWIVGDACTDDSQAVVESFGDGRLKWTNLAHNSGSQREPNNEGLRRASGQYIAYLGHDDLWFPWHLSGLVSFIQETNADLVYSLSALLSPDGLKHTKGPPGLGRTLENTSPPPSSWLHHIRLVKDCGFWQDPLKLAWGVDHDFLRRSFLARKEIVCCPQISLLKFPSREWRIYDSTSPFPQGGYLATLKSDPTSLEKDLLIEAATLLARQSSGKVTAAQAAKTFFRAVVRDIRDFHGRDGWPLAFLQVWLFQRSRRRLRVQRGLSSFEGVTLRERHL